MNDTTHTSSDAALSLLGGARTVLGEWRVADLSGVLPGGVAVQLERDRDGASLQVIVTARGGQCLVDTPYGGVLYHKHSGLTEREAGDTTRAFAGLVARGEFPLGAHFPHLVLGARPDADARRRYLQLAGSELRALPSAGSEVSDLAVRPRPTLYFDPPGIAEFLAPELVVDGPALAGYSLRAVYLPAVGKRGALDFTSYVLEFVDPDTAESPRLRLTARGHDPGFGRAGELSLSVLGFTQSLDAVPPRLASLCSRVLALLLLKGADGLALTVPADATGVRAMAHPADRGHAARGPEPEAKPAAAAPTSLNLALDAECGQRCAFCSVKAYVRPVDEGEAQLDRVRVQLRMARDQGVRELRLNGIDPLRFSRVLDVVREAASAGFERLWVYSTCRPLADPWFRRDFLDAASPMRMTVSVPVYGVTAAAHEAVTGTPGSFDEVMAALDGLCAEAPRGSVVVSTVAVKQNLHELADVVAMARARGLAVHPHLPYPMRQTTRDPYAASALRERDLVEHFVARVTSLPNGERSGALSVLGNAVPHPCLLWREEKKTRLPVFGARSVDHRQLLAGTEYRRSDIAHDTQGEAAQADAFAVATVPCPHAPRCALAPVCPAEHYAVYQSLYGLDEFAPVTVAELYQAQPPR